MFDAVEIKAYNRRARRDYNSVGLALLAQIGFLILVQVIFYMAGVSLMPRGYHDLLLYVASVLQNILPYVYFFVKHREVILPFFRLRTRLSPRRILGGSVFALGCNALVSIAVAIIVNILSRLGVQSHTPDFALSGSLSSQMMLLFFAVVAAPIVEEVLYRGVLYPVLRKYGVSFGILTSSLIFAIAHGNLQQSIPTFFVGMTLAYVTEMSGSIHEAILIHMLNNALAMVAGKFETAGGMLMLMMIPAAIAIFALWLAQGTRPTNNPYLPASARWFSFWTSPAIIVSFVLMLGILLLSLVSA